MPNGGAWGYGYDLSKKGYVSKRQATLPAGPTFHDFRRTGSPEHGARLCA